jgi:hypothetical protein
MEKSPKISVMHYLNKKVKPMLTTYLDSGRQILAYPIYYYITIKRKTIHKPSNIGDYCSENDFNGNNNPVITDMKNEVKTITKICELFLSDYERGKGNTQIKLLSNRGFTAKDEFINGLNSYIEYYSTSITFPLDEYIDNKADKYLFEKVLNVLDLSMIDNQIFSFKFGKDVYGYEKKCKFYEKNLDNNLLGLFLLYDILYCAERSKENYKQKYGGNFPIIEWFTGDLKTEIKKIVLKELNNNNFPLNWVQVNRKLNIDENHINEKFIKLLDEILTPEYQIKNKLESNI